MMERLKELVPLWAFLGFLAAAFGALGAMSPEDSLSRRIWYVLVIICLFVAFLAWFLKELRRVSRYLGRGIRTSTRFVRENLVLVAALVAVTLLLWRLFDLGRDPAVLSIVPLLVVACIALTIGLIRLLAITRPSFLGLPVGAEGSREGPAVPKDLWSYDFIEIEHFNDATTRKSAEQPNHIQVMQKAQSLGVVRPAIFEHPRSYGQTVLTYVVEQIPEHVREVELQFFTGILDIIAEQHSQFGTVPGNRIEFAILVNEGLVFREVRDKVGWSAFKRVRGLTPFGGALEVSFRTDAMGHPEWNWAVWGEPKLIEVLPPSAAG